MQKGAQAISARRQQRAGRQFFQHGRFMELIDLHTHSTASDGSDSPALLVQKAAEAGIAALALTDHDTLAGLEEAAETAAGLGMEFIRGCEISTRTDQGEIHVLGLWVPEKCDRLETFLATLRMARQNRNDMILELLRAAGVKITIEDVAAHAAGAVGRPHIATVLVEKGYAESRQEAFSFWLGRGGKAYVPKPVPPPQEAVKILAEAGASPIIAHPLLRPAPDSWLDSFVASLVPHGLSGLEAWHSAHTRGQAAAILDIARKYGLGVSGGSDYHGANKPGISLGTGRNNLQLGCQVLENLKQRRKKAGLTV